ncbi:alpha/beta hydrolase [Gordonia sp. PDNC005]|uniref:alpha/beta fold hydrolase n=1 Tax=unclassified Gordonia (in: high G+C Gram-positive bacteria) TaxID=2657482 RepID=UPI00196523FE|nr:alpha/beta hydrolase [Gordonia sp. PDNC005]QRY62171.1 alpha/beta hydrolase [Gordonia sp. PDNC005]
MTRHHTVDVGDITMHVTERGEGDAIVLCHGFPGLGYSWRHQIDALADAGYRVIAPDMRGYGRTDAPSDPRLYDREHTVADMVGLLDALDIDRAVFGGHDFGAHLVWDLPARVPDRVVALAQFSVPRVARMPVRPSVAFEYMAKQHFLHLHYFQRPGVAEVELDARPREFLAKLFHALSGDGRYLDCWGFASEGNGYLDVLPEPPVLPWSWLSEAEFNVYVDEFARTGFTGGLNWYRAEDLVWEQNAEFHDVPITVPTTFIVGAEDPVLQMMGDDPLSQTADRVPGLRSTHVIPGAGHFVQMEAADHVNRILIDFLDGLGRAP